MGITLLGLVVFLFAVGIVLFMVTQVVLPIMAGTPLFPLVRKSTPLKSQVAEAERELEEQTELVTLKEQLNKLNRRKAELENKE